MPAWVGHLHFNAVAAEGVDKRDRQYIAIGHRYYFCSLQN
jgi:hypothetical protein